MMPVSAAAGAGVADVDRWRRLPDDSDIDSVNHSVTYARDGYRQPWI